jgi:hypothetical protein
MVEVYVESELQELITDAGKTDEWKAKVQELGLDGQQSLIAGKKSPIPFPNLNSAMEHVYTTLCPSKQEFRVYNRTTMPTRVLEAIGLCVKENYFEKMEVWFDEIAPDPVLVGYHNKEMYLIARWGDELRSFPELRTLARERKLAVERTSLNKRQANLEMNVDEYLNGGWGYF